MGYFQSGAILSFKPIREAFHLHIKEPHTGSIALLRTVAHKLHTHTNSKEGSLNGLNNLHKSLLPKTAHSLCSIAHSGQNDVVCRENADRISAKAIGCAQTP